MCTHITLQRGWTPWQPMTASSNDARCCNNYEHLKRQTDLRDRQAFWKRSESVRSSIFRVMVFTSNRLKFCNNLNTFTNTKSSRILNVNIWKKSSSVCSACFMRASTLLCLLADKRLSNVGKVLRACLFLHKSVLPRLRTSCWLM